MNPHPLATLSRIMRPVISSAGRSKIYVCGGRFAQFEQGSAQNSGAASDELACPVEVWGLLPEAIRADVVATVTAATVAGPS